MNSQKPQSKSEQRRADVINRVAEKQTEQVAMGYARRKDLVEIAKGLASNPNVYPDTGAVGLVRMADEILNEIEKR